MHHRRYGIRVPFLLGFVLLFSLGLAASQAKKPRLVVFISVDQARFDYLIRFRPLFKDGLKLILDRGTDFTNTFHDYATTETGPGHATLSTGSFPSNSGIIANEWFDRGKKRVVNCVEDSASPVVTSKGVSAAGTSSGRSPRHLLLSGLGDWIRQADPESKVFAASRKDRGAILLGGLGANAAFWYDEKTGEFVTSQYYSRTYPEWIRAFTLEHSPARKFGMLWTPLGVTEAAARTAEIEAVNCTSTFPHPIGGLTFTPDAAYFLAFGGTPYMDEYLGEFAQKLIAQENLGQDDHLDYLGLSFSAVDFVGHTYGPNSPEALDTFLRLDQTLGALFRYLDRKVGLDRVVVSFSADHGVMGLPEYQKTKNLPGSRVTMEDVVCLEGIGAKLEEKFGKGNWLLDDLYLDYDSLSKKNLSQEQVERELSSWLARCPSVARVWTRTELLHPPANPDPFMVRFLHSFNPERSPDLLVQYKEYVLPHFGPGTGHGSPYDYDRHIPFVLIVPGRPPTVVDQEIRSVDIAPTVASTLGIKPDRKLDGVDRSSLVPHQPAVVSSR